MSKKRRFSSVVYQKRREEDQGIKWKWKDVVCIHVLQILTEVITINQDLLEKLFEDVKVNPRLRTNFDLRISAEDGSQ